MKIVIAYNKAAAVGSALVLLTIVAVVISLIRSTPPTPPAVAVKTAPIAPQAEEDEMTVDVAHDAASTPITHRFTVTLNTHSGDLSTFDAQTNIVYRSLQGKEMVAQSVSGDRETHHRTIALTFADVALPGTVVVKNLRSVPERKFLFK